MKLASFALAAAGVLALTVPAIVTPAQADVVTKSVTMHHGPFGHGCRTVRTVKRGPGGKRVVVRKVCG